MSNIAGKAYAMNLITPVNIPLAYLTIFFVPGIICALKAVDHLFVSSATMFPVGAGIIFLISGILFLGAGLMRWLKMTTRSNEFVFWILALFSFLFFGFSEINQCTLFVICFLSVGFLAVGFSFFRKGTVWLNKFIFWLAGTKLFQQSAFKGLDTLSLIHYARWVILRDKDFPRLSDDQPEESLNYGYMLFFSNFNGSWTQYVDSFSMSIPGGLNLLWYSNIRWPNAVPETPFNEYVLSNQIWTEHYYNAYPRASSNDVKSGQKVKRRVMNLSKNIRTITPAEFEKQYDTAILELQNDLSQMEPTPVVSLATEAIQKRLRIEKGIA